MLNIHMTTTPPGDLSLNIK